MALSRRPIRTSNRTRWWIAPVATLAILTAVVWSIMSVDDRDRGPASAATGAGGSAATGPPSPVEEYVQFAMAARDQQSDADVQQLVEGLRKLAAALATLNIGGPDLPIDLRVGAEHLLLNPASSEVTVIIRDDLIAAANALEDGTATDGALRGSAESIRTDRPLIEQPATILQFFGQAAQALQRRTPVSRAGSSARRRPDRASNR